MTEASPQGDFPQWLEMLIAEAERAPLGISWLPGEPTAPMSWRELDAFQADSAQQRLARSRLVGVAKAGPFRQRNADGVEREAHFWLDSEHDDTLHCALNPAYPPFLWFPVGRTVVDLQASLAPYFPQMKPPHSAVRLLLGVVEDFAQLENHLFLTPTFETTYERLGSVAYDAEVQVTQFHTFYSRSQVQLEYHHWLQFAEGRVVVAEVTYPPTAQQTVVAEYNRQNETDFPEDMPVDVLAPLMRYPMHSVSWVRRRLHETLTEPEGRFWLSLLYVVEADDEQTRADLLLASRQSDPQMRRRAASFAYARYLGDLLHEMAEHEQDPTLQQQIVEWAQRHDNGDDE